MAMTERQKIERWVDSRGWRYRGHHHSSESLVPAFFFGPGAAFGVFTLLVLMMGDMVTPGWHDTGSDLMPPWYGVGALIFFLIAYAVWGVFAIVLCKKDKFRDMTNVWRLSAQEDAVNLYVRLSDDEQKKLRAPLVDFLLTPADVRNAVYVQHRNAWTDLESQVNRREKLLLQSQALTAGNAVADYANSIRNEIKLIEGKALD
jgi:hypothetical protein